MPQSQNTQSGEKTLSEKSNAELKEMVLSEGISDEKQVKYMKKEAYLCF